MVSAPNIENAYSLIIGISNYKDPNITCIEIYPCRCRGHLQITVRSEQGRYQGKEYQAST